MKQFEDLTPATLRAWRLQIGATQAAAARWFGISRATFISWESGNTPIPTGASAICAMAHKRWKMRDLYGPVTLIFTDGPMWQNPFGAVTIPMMQRELYKTTHEAIQRSRELADEGRAHNTFIMDESGDVTWNMAELRREFDIRSSTLPRIPIITASEAKSLGRTSTILEISLTSDDPGWSKFNFVVADPTGPEDENFVVDLSDGPPWRVRNTNLDDELQDIARRKHAQYICIS